MKIAIHQPRVSYYVGGGEVIPLLQAKELSRIGHKVHLITSRVNRPETELFKEIKKEDIRIHYFPIDLDYLREKGWGWKFRFESIIFGYKTRDFYKKKDFDLVTTHLSSDSLQIPEKYVNILHLHGVPPEASELDKRSIKRPDCFVPVSKYVKKGWENLYPEIRRKNKKVIYNGINLKKFKPKDLKKEFDFLFLGRLLKHKGLRSLLKAFRRLEGDYNLAIGGIGPEEKWIRNYVRKHSLNVKLLGFIEEKDKVDLYNKAKVFMATSYRAEGVLTGMLEAMACKLDIVLSDACSMKEAFKEDYPLIFKNKNVKDLKGKMKESLETDFGKRNREIVKKRFSLKKQTKKLARYYSKSIR